MRGREVVPSLSRCDPPERESEREGGREEGGDGGGGERMFGKARPGWF